MKKKELDIDIMRKKKELDIIMRKHFIKVLQISICALLIGFVIIMLVIFNQLFIV